MSETTIVNSTADLCFQGKPYPGCPILLVNGQVEPAPSLWLFWVFRNRRASTALTYAKAIELWFRALHTTGLRWWEVVPTDLEVFMAGLADAGSSANTLRLRAAAVAQFYAWCHANGLIDRVAFTSSSGRRHPADTVRVGSARVPLPTASRRAVKSHTIEQFDSILGGLGRKLDLTLRRDELICEAGRYLGLRRSEVAGLMCRQFMDLDPSVEVQSILLDARTTKGGKARAVLAPRLYVQKVQRFIQGYRAAFVASLQARNTTYSDPGLLFLNERGKNAGAGIDPAYVSKTWKAASKAAGIESRFHNNRASLGTAAADRAIASGEQPLVIVKGLLRHEREETAQIYVDQAALKNDLLIRAKIVNDFYEAEPRA